MFVSEITIFNPKGITTHPISDSRKLTIGANKKILVLAVLGKIVSLANNFNPSASGCNNPKTPITFGPLRRCIAPIIFLSANVK
jgi:hypothetical protein